MCRTTTRKIMKRLLGYITLLMAALFMVQPAVAGSNHEELKQKELDVKEIVLSHIGDSYEWHITSTGHKHRSIPLLIIVKSESEGWHIFPSSRLAHGATYKGFKIAQEGEYAGKIVEVLPSGKERKPLDFSISKTAAGLWINSFIVILLILWVASYYRKRQDLKAPKGLRGCVEMLIWSLIDEVIRPCVGKNWRKFAPYLLTAFFFIFVNNIMGLIPIFPGGANVTGNIAISLVMALATFIAINLFGTKEYWKEIFWPEVPTWLKVPLPIMPAIEFIGLFTKPFALMIRLFANIMAGHAVILIITCIVFVTAKMGTAINSSMSAISVLLSIFMNCLELLVAYIQAYVFTMLSAVFIGLAQAEEHHS